MFKRLIINSTVLFSFSLMPLLAWAQSETNPDFAPNRVIVKWQPSVSARAQQSLQSQVRVAAVTPLELIGAEVWQLSGQSTEQAIALLRNQPGIAYVEPDYTLRAVTPIVPEQITRVIPNDVRFSDLWGLDNSGQNNGLADADIDAPEAWTITTGKPIIVGVIDSGTDWQHEDLAANIWLNPNEIPNNGIDDDNNGYVDDVRGWDFYSNDNNPMDEAGHGTHVAGTIAAVGNNKNGVTGVNWAARLMILRFLGPDGSGSTSAAIAAIEYAVKNKAHLTNNSWGGGQNSQALQDAIAAAGDAGQLFIAAAGNSGLDSDLTPHYPASFDLDNIVSVANTTRFDLLASSSTYGAKSVDLAAPGSTILSTLPNNDYGNLTGTSMASPHVAGVASLVLSVDPSLSHQALKNVLMTSVDTLKILSGKVVTSGRLNAFKAVTAADPDTTLPAVIIDLQTSNPASNELVLQWTASGDDGQTGTASAYEIRYAQTPIDENNFEQANLVPNPPAPQPAGLSEQFVLSGLLPETHYFIAMRVLDNVGNASALSNVAEGTTLVAPQIAIAPDSLQTTLLTGGTDSLSVTIANRSDGTLDFALSFSGDDLNWIAAIPASGRVPANDSTAIAIVIDASGLNARIYLAEVLVASNDPLAGELAIPLQLTVIGAPDIFTPVSAVDFEEVFINEQDSIQFVIQNIGTDTLRIDEVQIKPADFSVGAIPAHIAPGDSSNVTLFFAPPFAGDFSGTMTILSNDPDEQTVSIALSGRGVPPPTISIFPDSLEATLLTGQINQQTLVLSNSGGSDLTYNVQITPANDTTKFVQRGQAEHAPQLWASGADIPPDTAPQNPAPADRRIAAVTLPFRDGFESGDFSQWLIDDTTGMRQVTNSTAARGQYSFTYSNVVEGHFHGIHQEFESSQPTYISFSVRSGATTQSDAYFLLTANEEARNSVILFFARGNGFFFANGSTPGGDETFRYQANTWYKIEFKQIDWDEKHFDYYVDGVLIKEDIPFRNASFVTHADRAYLYNFSANAQAWWDQIIIGDPGTLWLDALPGSGIVAPKSQANLEVTFNADGLQENLYRAALQISSNDPQKPAVSVPVKMSVIDAPDVVFARDSLDFGTVYTGVSAQDSVHISNQGTDTLRVIDIRVDSPDFSAVPTSLTLPPDSAAAIYLELLASAPGKLTAVLTVQSNDPDESEVRIGLKANVLMPPEITVSPKSLEQTLFTGQIAKATLTVRNDNTESDTLVIDLTTISTGEPAGSALSRTGPSDVNERKRWAIEHSAQWQAAAERGFETAPVRKANPTISATLPVVISDAKGDGSSVDVTTVRALSNSEFIDFQIDFATAININDFGGALSLDLDQNPKTGMRPSFGLPQQDIGAEYELFFFNLRTGLVQLMRGATLIANYPLKIDTHSLRFSVLLKDVDGDDGIVNISGAMGPAASPNDWFPDDGHGTVQKAAIWLQPNISSAKIAGGGQLNIDFEFRATSLNSGLYSADIVIASSDPFRPTTRIPARLSVKGAPDIMLSDSVLAFGQVFVGYAREDSVTIRNIGTDSLQISSIVTDNPDFTTDASALILPPGAQKNLRVLFEPRTEGAQSAKLIVRSNDPDEAQAEVSLHGQAILPPAIAVEPAAFNLFLNPGEVHQRKLVIRNQGASLLTFSIRDEESGPVSPAMDGHLFWNVNSNIAEDTLYHSSLDGTNKQALFFETGLSGIAIDEANELLYRASFSDGSLQVSKFDGSASKTILFGLSGPVEIDVDAENGKIYWADFVDNIIARANLDGSGFEVIVAGQKSQRQRAFADVAGRSIRSAGLPGTRALGQPWGLALDQVNGKIYWTEQDADRLVRANLDGSAEEVLFSAQDSLNGPRGIVLDPAVGKLFFIDSFSGNVYSAALDGNSLESIYAFDPADNALSLSIDRAARKLYWTTNGTDLIQRMNYDGSGVKTVVQTNVVGFVGPFGVAVASRSGWLTQKPANGTIEAGQNLEVLLEIDASELQNGDYAAIIKIDSNDPARPSLEVPIDLRLDETRVVVSAPDTLSALPGDTIAVPISLVMADSTQRLATFGAALKIAGDVVRYLGSTPGPILTNQNLNVHAPAPDSVRMALLALGQQALARSGVLTTLHFVVDSSARGGEYALLFSDLSASTASGEGIAISGEAGKIVLQTHSITGTAFYAMSDGSADPNRPVESLEVQLWTRVGVVARQFTNSAGQYQLSELRPGRDFEVEVGRQAGGLAAALSPTDALLIVQAFLGNITLSPAQHLAADVDGNHLINPLDAGLIFNRFLGRISNYPTADWRAFPAEFPLSDSLDNWKKAPGRREHLAIEKNLTDQNFHAVAVGDVDLSWPDATPAASANVLAKHQGGNGSALVFSVPATTISPEQQQATIQIVLDGPALTNGIYALGGELLFDGSDLEVQQLRWSDQVATTGMRFDHSLQSATLNDASGTGQMRLKFGLFSLTEAHLAKEGPLFEIDVRLRKNLPPNSELSLSFEHMTAVQGLRASSSNGRHIAGLASTAVTAEISKIRVAELPKAFALAPNYPNPFNPGTRIRYQLAEPAQVRLAVFDALGRRVQALVEEQQKAGFYTVEWNGRDQQGRAVASGIYLLRIEAIGKDNTFLKTQKMLLMK